MTDEETAELVIDRLLRALAAQLETSGSPALAAGAVEALADLSRAQADVIFGQAGHLVHYGTDTEPLKTLIHAITAPSNAMRLRQMPWSSRVTRCDSLVRCQRVLPTMTRRGSARLRSSSATSVG
ncbi:hypothetical protein F6X54_34125, partial [Micromonospora aurantiaca]